MRPLVAGLVLLSSLVPITLAEATVPYPIGEFPLPDPFRQEYIDIGSDGTVFVGDNQNDIIQRFAPDGTYLGSWLVPNYGRGLGVAPDGRVYTFTPLLSPQVEVRSPNGTYQGGFAVGGMDPGELQFPWDLTFDDEGYLYICEGASAWNHARISKFTVNGSFVDAWGSQGSGTGQFMDPTSIEFGPDGNLYLADAGNRRVLVFETDGTFVRWWPVDGYPNKLSVDAYNNVWICDIDDNELEVYTHLGALQGSVGNLGNALGEFSTCSGQGSRAPNDVRVDRERGVAAVTDCGNGRVQWFSAVPRNGPQVAFHIAAATAKTHCGAAPVGCGTLTTFAPSDPAGAFYNVYMLGTASTGDPGLAGLQVGIEVGGDLQIDGWTRCTDSQVPVGSWPLGGGNTLFWSSENCPEHPAPALGYFYVAAYGPGFIAAKEHPTAGGPIMAPCSGAEATVDASSRGWAAFAASAGTLGDGCNPCLAPCSAPTTTGAPALPVPETPLRVAPNPSRGPLRVEFALTTPGAVRWVVLDVAGRIVREIDFGVRGIGAHTLRWDGRDDSGRRASPGVYFHRLLGPAGESNGRLVLLP